MEEEAARKRGDLEETPGAMPMGLREKGGA